MKQTERLLAHFERNGSITPMQALSELGIYRLGARVYDLREAGHDIATHRFEVADRHGSISRPAKYVYKGKAHANQV